MRHALWLVLGLGLCWPVVSSLAFSGHRHMVSGRSDRIVAVAAQHRKLADLDVKAATVALRAGVLTGSATVVNVGARRAPSSMAGIAWRSAVSGGTVQIGRVRVSALAPGGQDKAHFRVAVPKDASGTYVVGVCADVLGQLRELSKKNKCRKAGTVTVSQSGSGVKGYGPTGTEPPPSSPPPGGSTPPTGPSPTPVSSPPDTTIGSGPTGIIGMSSATFVFHGSDTNDTFQCSLDGVPWAACTSPQQYTSLADGAHTFKVRAVNTAGEADPTPAEATWTVGTTPPAVTLTAPTDGSMTNNNVPTFSGTAGTNSGDSPAITVNIYAGFSAAGMPVQTLTATAHSGSWSVPANAPLEDGTYTAQAIQHDEVGNVGESSADTFTIDTTPPGPVTALRIVPADDGLHIEWTNPSDADYAGVMIRRSEGDTPPSSPASGTLITTAPPSTTTIDDTTVTPGQTYSYAVFAYDYVPNYAVAATATQTMPACTDSWTGNAGSLDWGTAGNWSKNHTPGAGDVACIFGGEHEPSVTYVSGTSSVGQFVATRPVTISGGELDLSAKTLVSEATNLTLSGGAIGGQGQLILHGQTEWTAGVVMGEGDTTIPAGSTLTLNSGGCCNAILGENHSLTVGGQFDVVGASQLRFQEGAK
ncbi:MAG TPA: Ig-like domain-containing protein, partial [Steroidobacteraceae bacterium]|nr:Ig-like domain-containing protein [Steroidobacteraceae bacterium]